jgi:hypothetical protein
VGITDPSHGTKCTQQSDHVERSDLTKRFFIAGWERKRAKRVIIRFEAIFTYADITLFLFFRALL